MGQHLYFCKILSLTNRPSTFLAPTSPTIGLTKVSNFFLELYNINYFLYLVIYLILTNEKAQITQLASCRGENFIIYDSKPVFDHKT